MPVFQTQEDKENENAAAKVFADRWGLLEDNFGDSFSSIDRVLYKPDGRIRAFFEVKCRRAEFETKREYMIEAQKIHDGLALAEQYKVNCLLVVRFAGRNIYWAVMQPAMLDKVTNGGRTNLREGERRNKCAGFPFEFLRRHDEP